MPGFTESHVEEAALAWFAELGYTVLNGNNHAINRALYRSLPYDDKDFVPVTTVCSFPFLITVGPMVPPDVQTLAAFVKWCAANPKQAAVINNIGFMKIRGRSAMDRC